MSDKIKNSDRDKVIGRQNGLAKEYYPSGALKTESNFTDGLPDSVTEAQNQSGKMFGEERLKKALNQKEMSLADTLTHVHQSIKKFVKKAPQSDDITMLALEFHHKKTLSDHK